jgi:hypothetical protein
MLLDYVSQGHPHLCKVAGGLHFAALCSTTISVESQDSSPYLQDAARLKALDKLPVSLASDQSLRISVQIRCVTSSASALVHLPAIAKALLARDERALASQSSPDRILHQMTLDGISPVDRGTIRCMCSKTPLMQLTGSSRLCLKAL